MQQLPLCLLRRDPAQNMARFYALDLECDLFGDWVVLRRWGRIGKPGRASRTACTGAEAALALIGRLEQAKRRRGYLP